MKAKTQVYLILFFCFSCTQGNKHSNEKIIFSFSTEEGKTLTVANDTLANYLSCRYGTPGHPDFDFPEEKENSWDRFKYSYYMRGGGPENAGLDLNYLYFNDDDFQYIVFDEYDAESDRSVCGLRINNLNTNESNEIVGNNETQTGSLVEFRFDDRIETIEE